MSQQKKSGNRGRGNVRTGSKRTGSTKKSEKKTSVRKASPKKATRKASPKKSTEKAATKPRRQAAARRPATESAPSLAQAPRRKPTKKESGDTAKKVATRSSRPPDSDSDSDSGNGNGNGSQFDDSSNPMDLDILGIGSPVFPPGGFDLGAEDEEDDTLGDGSDENPWADDPSVEMRIREIEERLDGLMTPEPHGDLDQTEAVDPQVVAPTSADTAVDAAREVLESEYYRKKWGRTSLRDRSNEVDDFGMDPGYEGKLRPALDFLFRKYFRVEVEGIRHVPAEGRAVVVANHSGALPFDGVMLREAIRQRHPGREDLRWLAEDFSFYLPFLGVTLNRIGAVRACPENAERLLAKEHLVGVFPEGAEGIKKLYKNRYRLQRFGRGGFVRLCLKTQSPIIPCAIIGAEETNPILYRFDNLSKLLGLDYLPITPTFPWLGPLGLLPAPTKWKIVFGEPISVEEYGPQAEHDHVLVGRLAERIRTNVGDLLEAALRRRSSIWL